MITLRDPRRIFLVTLVFVVVILVTVQTRAIDTLQVRINRYKGEPAAQGVTANHQETLKEEPVVIYKPAVEDEIKPGAKPQPMDKDSQTVERPTYTNATGDQIPKNERLAYAVYFTGGPDVAEDYEEDNYFIAVRILVWQLLHVPQSRTKHDVVVVVTPTVSQSRRDRLRRDGAVVHSVEFVENEGWSATSNPLWVGIMTKLRLWQMTQYSRIVLFDGDSMVRHNLDDVFNDPGAQLMRSKDPNANDYNMPTKGTVPETYLLAGLSEVWSSDHEYPPTDKAGLKELTKFNAGFFMMAPSDAAFDYYMSFLETKDSFNPEYQEQNLLNRAHEWDGPMPWREISYTWNVRTPNQNDFDHGLPSLHEKWWIQTNLYDNEGVKDWLRSRRHEMKGWYDAWDSMHPHS